MAVAEATLQLLVTMKDEASSAASSIGSTLGTIGTVAGGVALAGVAAFGAALADGIGDAREAALINAQTQQVLTTTGNAAGVSAQHVQDYASALSAASGASLFGDDQIQQSTNLLLTFTNIKGATLDAATAISVDMAQALGGAPKDAAIQLGKALNDPIAGVSALSRVGVSFNDQQKEQIKTMQEAGDTAGAQAIILAELNKEFGGQAAAAAQADGGWAQFNDRLGEAKEALGTAVLPLLTSLMGLLNDYLMPLIEAGAQAFSAFVGSLQSTGGAAGALSGPLSAFQKVLGDVWAAAQEVFNTLMTEGKPIMDDLGKIVIPMLVAEGQVLAAFWTNVLAPALSDVWYVIKTYLIPGIGALIHILSIVLPPIITTVADIMTNYLLPAVNMIIRGIELMGKGVEGVITFFTNLANSISSIQIPAWLQGHSPPPMANWLTDIADAASSATSAAGDLGFGGGGVGAGAALAGSSSSTTITVGQIVVQGAQDPQATALVVRQELIKLGQRNLDIFGGLA